MRTLPEMYGGGRYTQMYATFWRYISEVRDGVQRNKYNFQLGGRWTCTDFRF